MTKGLNFDLKRTGFPVTLAGVELWFDSSPEKLINFLSMEKIVEEKMKVSRNEIKGIEFSEEVDVSEETGRKVINAGMEPVALQYDLMFGEGTFKKLYEKVEDYQAFENALEPLIIAILEKVETESKELTKSKKNEALNKKAVKKK